MAKLGMLPDPLEHFQAGGSRHFDVQQDERRHWVAAPVGINTDAVKICYCFFAIFDVLQIEMRPGAAGRGTQELDIIRVIINVQNGKNSVRSSMRAARTTSRPRYRC